LQAKELRAQTVRSGFGLHHTDASFWCFKVQGDYALPSISQILRRSLSFLREADTLKSSQSGYTRQPLLQI